MKDVLKRSGQLRMEQRSRSGEEEENGLEMIGGREQSEIDSFVVQHLELRIAAGENDLALVEGHCLKHEMETEETLMMTALRKKWHEEYQQQSEQSQQKEREMMSWMMKRLKEY